MTMIFCNLCCKNTEFHRTVKMKRAASSNLNRILKPPTKQPPATHSGARRQHAGKALTVNTFSICCVSACKKRSFITQNVAFRTAKGHKTENRATTLANKKATHWHENSCNL